MLRRDHRAPAARPRSRRTGTDRRVRGLRRAEPRAQPRTCFSTVGQPIRVNSTLLHGRRTPLNHVRGGRRGERVADVRVRAAGCRRARARARGAHVWGACCAGCVSREALLAEKALLAAGCSFAVALAMLAGIGAFVSLDWSRAWLVAAWRSPSAPWRSARWAWRSARSRARCARPRCSRSCCRCRWRFWRSCPPASVTAASTTRSSVDLVRVPVQGGAAGARRGRQRRLAGDSAARCPSGGATLAVRRARPPGPARASLRARLARSARRSNLRGDGLSTDAHAQAAGHAGAARAGPRDRPARRRARAAAVRRRAGRPRPGREPIATMPGVERLSIAAAVAGGAARPPRWVSRA